jgi:hypothetical protein
VFSLQTPETIDCTTQPPECNIDTTQRSSFVRWVMGRSAHSPDDDHQIDLEQMSHEDVEAVLESDEDSI